MFCGEMPCECNKKPPVAPRERRIRHVEDVELPTTKARMRDAMKVAFEINPQVEVETALEGLHPEDKEAIRVLLAADILSAEDRTKYASLITPNERAKNWKERNGSDNTEHL